MYAYGSDSPKVLCKAAVVTGVLVYAVPIEDKV